MRKKLNAVLLVDDDKISNLLCRIDLEAVIGSCEITMMESAKEAIDYIAHCGEISRGMHTLPCPDLILLDIEMPGMDGWKFLDEYRKIKSHYSIESIIIMVSSSINAFDKSRALNDPDVSGIYNKPVSEEMITHILPKYFSSYHCP